MGREVVCGSKGSDDDRVGRNRERVCGKEAYGEGERERGTKEMGDQRYEGKRSDKLWHV